MKAATQLCAVSTRRGRVGAYAPYARCSAPRRRPRPARSCRVALAHDASPEWRCLHPHLLRCACVPRRSTASGRSAPRLTQSRRRTCRLVGNSSRSATMSVKTTAPAKNNMSSLVASPRLPGPTLRRKKGPMFWALVAPRPTSNLRPRSGVRNPEPEPGARSLSPERLSSRLRRVLPPWAWAR
jgi:hypothetical protein